MLHIHIAILQAYIEEIRKNNIRFGLIYNFIDLIHHYQFKLDSQRAHTHTHRGQTSNDRLYRLLLDANVF